MAVRDGTEDFNKVEFLHVIKEIRYEAFKSLIVKYAFRKAGIWPINAEIVLSKIRPKTPPPQAESDEPSTPATLYTARDIEEFTRRYLYGQDLYIGEFLILNYRVTRLLKGAIATTLDTKVNKLELQRLNVRS